MAKLRRRKNMFKKIILLAILIIVIALMLVGYLLFFTKTGFFVSSLLFGKIGEIQDIKKESTTQEKVCTEVSYEVVSIDCKIEPDGGISIEGTVKNTGQELLYLIVGLVQGSGSSLVSLEENIKVGEIRNWGPYTKKHFAGSRNSEGTIDSNTRFSPVIYLEGEEQECGREKGQLFPINCN